MMRTFVLRFCCRTKNFVTDLRTTPLFYKECYKTGASFSSKQELFSMQWKFKTAMTSKLLQIRNMPIATFNREVSTLSGKEKTTWSAFYIWYIFVGSLLWMLGTENDWLKNHFMAFAKSLDSDVENIDTKVVEDESDNEVSEEDPNMKKKKHVGFRDRKVNIIKSDYICLLLSFNLLTIDLWLLVITSILYYIYLTGH